MCKLNYTLSEVTADSKAGSYLIHGVDNNGEPLCKRVKAENLTGYSPPGYSEPTCKYCLWEVRHRV